MFMINFLCISELICLNTAFWNNFNRIFSPDLWPVTFGHALCNTQKYILYFSKEICSLAVKATHSFYSLYFWSFRYYTNASISLSLPLPKGYEISSLNHTYLQCRCFFLFFKVYFCLKSRIHVIVQDLFSHLY